MKYKNYTQKKKKPKFKNNEEAILFYQIKMMPLGIQFGAEDLKEIYSQDEIRPVAKRSPSDKGK